MIAEKHQQVWNKICTGKTVQNVSVFLGAAILLAVLGNSIVQADTVWELGDEAGYLANVAFFLGEDWDAVRAINPYFAYGYSVILIPVYLCTDTGVELIQGAMWVNAACVLGVYFILIYLLRVIGGQKNKILAAGISFITCLNSYLCCNALKVNCESLLTLWHCLVAVLLYKAMDKRKNYRFLLLGIAAAYSFFIHTRAFVLIIACFISIVLTWRIDQGGRKEIGRLGIFIVGFVLVFAGGYCIKNAIIHSAAELGVSDRTGGNLISGSYISSRIAALLAADNMKFYFLGFAARVYYIIVASAGTIFFAYTALLKELWHACKKRLEESPSFAVKVYLCLSAVLMVIVCTLNNAGTLDNFRYFFYSRYYENTIVPLIALGLSALCSKGEGKKDYFIFMCFTGGVGIATARLNTYLDSDQIYKDTARIPAFSWIIENAENYQEMVYFGTLVMILLLVVFLGCKKTKLRRAVCTILVLVLTWKSTSIGIEMIHQVHVKAAADAEIAGRIQESSRQAVYMIDDRSFRYNYYYSRMQVLLKDIPMNVIEEDAFCRITDIEDNAWVLTYKDTVLKDTYLADMEEVMGGSVFALWRRK